MSISAYKLATTLTEDGTLLLQDLPCPAGTSVEVIVLVAPQGTVLPQAEKAKGPISGKVKDSGADYMTATANAMTEWNSEADNSAYRHL
jgi:hypothetical protein